MSADIKWACSECNWVGFEKLLLTGVNPFDGDGIVGCPNCKSIDSMCIVCDEPECEKKGTCGWPSKNGYRWTCYEHWQTKDMT